MFILGPISGVKCTQIIESADPHGWDNNYLCVPNDAPYQFVWSSALAIKGKKCLKWSEPAEYWQHTWGDNYLCA